MSKHFILKNKEIIEIDLMTWAKWFETSERIVAKTVLNKGIVSTIFLGIDHSFIPNSPIEKMLLFETMVFNSGTELDNEPFRYSTYDQAVKGHDEIVKKLKQLTWK